MLELTFDQIPKDTAWSIERSFSVADRARRDVRCLHLRRLLDRHHARQLRAGAPGHHGRPLLRATVFRNAKKGWAAGRRAGRGSRAARALFRRRGRGHQSGARPLPYGVIGRHTHVEEAAVVDNSIIWPNGWIGREAQITGSILGRNCHIGRNAIVEDGAVSATRPSSRITASYEHQSIDFQGIRCSRPLPVRGERGGGAADRARFRRYLQAKRIGVSRDMRLSSPSVATSVIDGARSQGADVVDYGMNGTDMMYYVVARDGLDGGAQITASHNPNTTASRWCAARRFP